MAQRSLLKTPTLLDSLMCATVDQDDREIRAGYRPYAPKIGTESARSRSLPMSTPVALGLPFWYWVALAGTSLGISFCRSVLVGIHSATFDIDKLNTSWLEKLS